MSITIVLALLIGQAAETKAAQDSPKSAKIIVVDEDNDGLPGARVGPTRKDLEDLIRGFGREPVTAELVERLDGLYRPRWSAQRRYDDARRRMNDPDFIALIDGAAKEVTGKPADTRAIFYRAAIEYEGVDPETIKQAVRDDIARESAPKKTIRGRIVDDRSGKPIEGAVVASISGMMTRTDARGQYVLKTRPPKSTNPMSVTVEAPGYALTQSYFAWDEMKEDVTNDIRLEKAIVFGGQVVDPQGRPIAGAILDLWLHNEAICHDGSMTKVNFNTTVTLRAKSGPDGIFAFRNMPPDLPDRQAVVSLTATHPEYESRTKNYAQNEELGPGWQITLVPGCVVSGTVLDESGKPLPSANVRVFSNQATTLIPAVQTDPEGRFRFGGLPEGQARLVAQPSGMPAVNKEVVVNRLKPIEVKITAEAGTFLTGKVVDLEGKPVKDARVGWLQRLEVNGKPVVNEMATDRFAMTKDDGTFRVGPVLKGKYRITAVLQESNSTGSADAEAGGKDALIEIKPQVNRGNILFMFGD